MKQLPTLLQALADLTATEAGLDALATAQALAAGKDHGFSLAKPSLLDAEIRALAGSDHTHPVARLIADAQAYLPWAASPAAGAQPAHLAAVKAVATLLDPEGPIRSDHFRLGLFYQAPGIYYSLHAHEAAETYTILAGTAQWRAGNARLTLGPGQAIHHPPQMPHAMRAGPKGFLAIWRWSGDISFASYRMLPDPDAQGEAG